MEHPNKERFFGRQRELRFLEEAYKASRSAFVPIYGRRRVGKSELILQFIKNKTSIYFLGKRAMAPLQIQEFMGEAACSFKEPLLERAKVEGWREALQWVIAQKKTAQKLVLVLDEFQWIVEASPELPSILQELWDREWRTRKDIFLILCGSYMGFMEQSVLGEKSPLYGRRTGQILLKPFSYLEAAAFHPSWSLSDRAKVYFICGGIPFYLLFFSENHSLLKNIEINFFDEFSPLYREADFLLREELRELPKYYTILTVLSTGTKTSKEIATATGIDERKLYYYLQTLVELGYVKRRYPLTSRPPVARAVRFSLDDPLLCFWFRFIYPHTAYVAKMGASESLTHLVKPYLDAYFGTRFEVLCREALGYLYQREGIHSSFEIGEYWDKDMQIDVVGYRKGDGIDIGECKWGRVGTWPTVLNSLGEGMTQYPNPFGLTLTGRIFSQYPVRSKQITSGIRVHDLTDLYSLS